MTRERRQCALRHTSRALKIVAETPTCSYNMDAKIQLIGIHFLESPENQRFSPCSPLLISTLCASDLACPSCSSSSTSTAGPFSVSAPPFLAPRQRRSLSLHAHCKPNLNNNIYDHHLSLQCASRPLLEEPFWLLPSLSPP